MPSETETQLARIMARVFNIPDPELTRCLQKDDGTTWDSLRHVELIFAVEDAFQVRFSDADFAGLRSFEQIARRIEELRRVVA